MKFITLKNFLLLLALGLAVFVSCTETDDAAKRSKAEYKMLFVYYNTSNKDPSHPLNKFDYKNLVMNNDQIVVFVSNTPSVSTDDNDYQTSNYLYTMKYINIDLPCLGKTYLCSHAQFIHEYKKHYPEIVTIIPKDIQEKMGDAGKASKNCVVISRGTFLNVDQLVWVCNEDLQVLYDFQDQLSRIVTDTGIKPYSGVIEYVKVLKYLKIG
jgi:hypothetical protein